MKPSRRVAAVLLAAAAAAAVPLSVASGNEPTNNRVTDPVSHYERVPSPPPAPYMERPECTPGYECGDSGHHGDVPAPS